MSLPRYTSPVPAANCTLLVLGAPDKLTTNRRSSLSKSCMFLCMRSRSSVTLASGFGGFCTSGGGGGQCISQSALSKGQTRTQGPDTWPKGRAGSDRSSLVGGCSSVRTGLPGTGSLDFLYHTEIEVSHILHGVDTGTLAFPRRLALSLLHCAALRPFSPQLLHLYRKYSDSDCHILPLSLLFIGPLLIPLWLPFSLPFACPTAWASSHSPSYSSSAACAISPTSMGPHLRRICSNVVPSRRGGLRIFVVSI